MRVGWSDHRVDRIARKIVKEHTAELKKRKNAAAEKARNSLPKAGAKPVYKPIMTEKEFNQLRNLHKRAHEHLNKKEIWE